MATVRVHELAKELKLSSKDTIALLSKVGIRASTHMSVIDQHRAEIVKGVLLGNLAKAAKTHKPAAKPVTSNGSPTAAPETPAATAPKPTIKEAQPKPAAASSAPAAVEPPQLKPVPATVRPARPASPQRVVPAASASPSTPAPAQVK